MTEVQVILAVWALPGFVSYGALLHMFRQQAIRLKDDMTVSGFLFLLVTGLFAPICGPLAVFWPMAFWVARPQ